MHLHISRDIQAIIYTLLPVLAASGIGASLQGKKSKIPPYLLIPLFLVWIVLLPGMCTLLLQWRQEMLGSWWSAWLDRRLPSAGMYALVKSVGLLMLYIFICVMAITLSIRPVEMALRSRKVHLLLWAPILFYYVAYVIFLIYFVRFHPLHFSNIGFQVKFTFHFLRFPNVAIAVGVLAALLWMIYEGGELWLESALKRLK